MKIDSPKCFSGKLPSVKAFTLIELLVVIAIIGILAAMLMPVLSVAQQHAKKTTAKLDVNQLASAIEEYESEYSRFPIPTAVQQSGQTNVTFGGVYTNAANPTITWPTFPQPGYYPSNSDVIAILMNFTNYPSGGPTANVNYQKNPQQHTFLSAKMAPDNASPGVGFTDLNYRDPWGSLYIITMDLNEDNKTEDPFYEDWSISSSTGVQGGAGLNGLIYQPADGNYAFHGNVMVWSMGPDGPFDHANSTFTYQTTPDGTTGWANDPSNKNHILSWQ